MVSKVHEELISVQESKTFRGLQVFERILFVSLLPSTLDELPSLSPGWFQVTGKVIAGLLVCNFTALGSRYKGWSGEAIIVLMSFLLNTIFKQPWCNQMQLKLKINGSNVYHIVFISFQQAKYFGSTCLVEDELSFAKPEVVIFQNLHDR